MDFSTSPSSEAEILPSPFVSNWLKTFLSSAVSSRLMVVEDAGAVVSGLGFEIGSAIFGIYLERGEASSFRWDVKRGKLGGQEEIGNLYWERSVTWARERIAGP